MALLGPQIIKVARSLPVDQRSRLLSVFKVAKGSASSPAARSLINFFLDNKNEQESLEASVGEAFDRIASRMGPMPRNIRTAKVEWGPEAPKDMVKELLDEVDDGKLGILDESKFRGITKYYNGIITSMLRRVKSDTSLKVTYIKVNLVDNYLHITAEVIGSKLGEDNWPEDKTQEEIKAGIESIGGYIHAVSMGKHPKSPENAYFDFEAEWEFSTSVVIKGVFSNAKLESIAYDSLAMVGL